MPRQPNQVLSEGNPSSVVGRGFVGLSVKMDFINRPNNSWWVLQDFDLYIPGSIRKTPYTATYASGYGLAGPVDVLNVVEYLAQANNPQGGIRRLIGIGQDGNLYDMAATTGTGLYVEIPALESLALLTGAVPTLLEYPGYYVPFNMRSWVASTDYAQFDGLLGYGPDGNIYIFYASTGGTSGSVAPIWPVTGTVTDGSVVWTNAGEPTSQRFFAYYIEIIYPGVLPIRVVEWQYDPTNSGETPKYTIGFMGSPSATVPPEIGSVLTTPNLDGYAPSAGRGYCWTYYNPNTLQESSPSFTVGQTKITETDNSNVVATINGSVLLPLPPTTTSTPYTSYQSYYVAIPASVINPPPGDGYTSVRFYATKDGGTNFFLVNTLFDQNGNQLTNADGSIPAAVLFALSTTNSWTDYFPIPGSQAAIASCRVYEGSGVVNYAPDPQNLSSIAWQEKTPGGGTTNLGTIFVSSGIAPDGNNAFVDETSSTGDSFRSAGIPVTPGTEYYFQMFLDKANATGGVMAAYIIHTNGGTKILSLVQADSTASILSGTFTAGAGVHKVQIEIFVNNDVTIAADSQILWYDPVLQVGSTLSAIPTNYPTPDQSLITPAPVAFANNQPPIARFGTLWNNAMWWVDSVDPTKIWYSQQGLYELVGVNNYIRSTTNIGTSVMELIPLLDRLLITKERSTEQIFNYPPEEPTPLDPQHGVLAYRSTVPYGAAAVSLMTNGLGRLSLVNIVAEGEAIDGNFGSVLIGDDVKPIIDSISSGTLYAQNLSNNQPSPAIYNALDMYLLAFRPDPDEVGYSTQVLARYMGRSTGFSLLTTGGSLPNQIITLKEVRLPTGGNGGFASAGNGQISLIALTSQLGGVGNNAVVVLFQGGIQSNLAIAVTQPLPTPTDLPEEYWDTNKHFDYLYVDGQDIQNFQVQFMPIYSTNVPLPDPLNVNNYHQAPQRFVNNRVKIGLDCKLLAIRFEHLTTPAAGVTPMITQFKLSYRIIQATVTG